MSITWVDKGGYDTGLIAENEGLGQEGVQIQLVRLKKGKYQHYHKKKTEVFYFISGSGKLILEGKELEVKSGSHFVIKSGMKHTFINENEEPLVGIMMKTNNEEDDTFTD